MFPLHNTQARGQNMSPLTMMQNKHHRKITYDMNKAQRELDLPSERFLAL